MQKKLIKVFSGIGIILFASILVISFIFTKQLETTAVKFLKNEITTQIHSKVDFLFGLNVESQSLIQKAMLKRYLFEVPILKKDLEKLTNSIINQITQDVSKAKEEKELSRIVETSKLTSKLWDFKLVKSTFNAIDIQVADKYTKIWTSLLSDIRIFSMINLGSFILILILISWIKEASEYLIVCSWILLFSPVVIMSIYMFFQNWFYTVLFDQYYGTGYLSLLLSIFGYLFVRMSIEFLMDYGLKENSENYKV